MHASMAVMNAYFTPRSHIWSARRSSLAFASLRSTLTSSATDRNRRRTRTSSTTADTFRELAVGSRKPWQFVEVDLPRHRSPPHPRHLVVVEQQPTLDRNAPSQLERSLVEHQQINSARQRNVVRGRRVTRPPRCHVEIGIGTLIASSLTAEDKPEASTTLAQRGDHLLLDIRLS